MNKKEIGINAGKVWRLLSDNARWSFEKLKGESHLKDFELATALGWLAREDKIEFDQRPEGLSFYLCVNVYIG